MRKPSLYDPNIAISREIDSSYDNVKLVADNLPTIISVNDAIEAGTFDNINEVLAEPLKSNIGTLAAISTDISAVAGISANVTAVANNEADIDTLATNMASINTVAGAVADVTTVAASIAAINTVSANMNNILSVDGNKTNINAVAGSISDVTTTADNITSVNTVAGDTAAINDVASEPLRSSVLSAGANATEAQLRAWDAEAERMTADSYATEAEDTFVNVYTSDGDGTFTAIPTTEYSALHWRNKAEAIAGGTAAEAELLVDVNKHGVASGDLLVTVDGTDLDLLLISAGTYYLNGVKHAYAGGSFDTSALGAGDFGTIGINSVGVIVLRTNDFFTEAELENVCELSAFAKFTSNTIDVISDSKFNITDFIRNMMIRAKAFEGTKFNGTAGLITENATSLRLDVSQGYINTPNAETKLISAATQIGGAGNYRVAGTYELVSQSPLVVSDTQYDDGTDLANIPASMYTVHTLARSSRTGGFYLIYGTDLYNSEGDAKAGPYNLGQFSANEATSEIEPLANIVVQQGAGINSILDLRNASAGVTSSVLSNLSLQSAYDLSTLPQIQLAAGNELEVRNDVGDTNTVLQKWTNSAGTSIIEINKTGIDLGGLV